jgi:transcriptional regulator with XRE-family HTH domain
MSVIVDKEHMNKIRGIVGARLKAARVAAGLKLSDVQHAIGHKGITQLSLMESGERLPPFHLLVRMADIYAVPLDYLAGRNDDPIADPIENNQGVIVGAVASAINQCIDVFGKSIGEYTCIAVSGQRRDRVDLMEVCEIMEDVRAAFHKVKELNPEFDEDWRGGARLESSIEKVIAVASKVNNRMKKEQMLRDGVEAIIPRRNIEDKSKQFLLDFFAL